MRRLAFGLTVLLSFLLLGNTKAQTVWFDDLIGTRQTLSATQGSALLETVRLAIEHPDQPPIWPAFAANDATPRLLLLSLSNGSQAADVFIGSGMGWRAAAESAWGKANSASAHGPVIKLDVVTSVTTHRGMPERLGGDRSLFGLALNRDLGAACVPEETVARTLVNSKGKVQLSNLQELLVKRSPSNLSQDALRNAPVLFTFTTDAWAQDGRSPKGVPLYRGHRLFAAEDLTDGVLLEAARRAGQYLTQAVRENGEFDYKYLPKQNSVPTAYNMLRHCGTVYAMLDLCATTGDSALMDATTRALDWMAERVLPWSPGVSVLPDDDDDIKVGGQGLALVALAEYAERTGDLRHLRTMQNLAGYLASIQQPDGQFVPHKLDLNTRTATDFVSGYYPGEAMLGLARLHALDGDPRWIDVAMANAQYITQKRDRGVASEDLPHDHWLLYALNALYLAQPEPWLLAQTERYGQAIVDAQRTSGGGTPPDWTGSFYTPPRSTPSATRAEGLLAAATLLRECGDPDVADGFLLAAEQATAFMLQLQFDSISAMYLDDPQRIDGGFRKSMTNYTVQIDYVQHSLSAVLALMRTPMELRSAGAD